MSNIQLIGMSGKENRETWRNNIKKTFQNCRNYDFLNSESISSSSKIHNRN